MRQPERTAAKNMAFPVQFIVQGAQKRRDIAYGKAKLMQVEMGITPHLASVK